MLTTSCSIVISHRCTVHRENEPSSHLSPVLSPSRIDVSSTEAFVERNSQSKCSASLFPFFFFVSFRLILMVAFWRNNWFDREWFNYSSRVKISLKFSGNLSNAVVRVNLPQSFCFAFLVSTFGSSYFDGEKSFLDNWILRLIIGSGSIILE